MDDKSDSTRHLVHTITATQASRDFSRILDRVEGGSRFIVHRRGRPVCSLSPPPSLGRTVSECLALLRDRPAVTLDDGFAADLSAVIEGEVTTEPPAWDS